jgi:hypothetical protein
MPARQLLLFFVLGVLSWVLVGVAVLVVYRLQQVYSPAAVVLIVSAFVGLLLVLR